MLEAVLLLAFGFVLAVAGLATVIWEFATGRFFNIDGVWLALIALMLSTVFSGNLGWSIYTGELKRIRQKSSAVQAAAEPAKGRK